MASWESFPFNAHNVSLLWSLLLLLPTNGNFCIRVQSKREGRRNTNWSLVYELWFCFFVCVCSKVFGSFSFSLANCGIILKLEGAFPVHISSWRMCGGREGGGERLWEWISISLKDISAVRRKLRFSYRASEIFLRFLCSRGYCGMIYFEENFPFLRISSQRAFACFV